MDDHHTVLPAGHGRILRRYAKKIVLLFDSDTAGIEAANRALEICLFHKIDIKLASVPQGKDPCDFLLMAGKERFEELIDSAADVFEFKWNRLKNTFNGTGTLVDNKAAVEEFLQAVAAAIRAGNLAAIDRGLIINRLSKIIALDAKQITAELNKRLAMAARSANYPVATKMENQKVQKLDLGEGLFAAAQREILEVLLNEPKLFENVKQKITAEDFNVPILGRMVAVLFEVLAAEPSASLATILAKAESASADKSVELGIAIVELAQAGEEKGNFLSRLNGAVEVISRHQMQKKKDRIKSTKDQTQFLRSVSKTTSGRNPHNVGMV